MVDYLPRSAWGARAPRSGPGNLTVSRVEGAVIHWPGTGSTSVIHTKAAVASALRGWQDYHMDDHGWSDIAYQVAVDQAGRAWNLRGLRTQSGANGNNDLNERYGAVLLVLVTGEEPTADMKATVREVLADFRRIYPKGTAIKPHSAVRPDGTDCPGDAARAAIKRGDFTPGVVPTPPPPPPVDEGVFDMAITLDEFANVLDQKLQKYTVADNNHDAQAAAWEAAANAYAAKRFAEGADFTTVKDELFRLLQPLWVTS